MDSMTQSQSRALAALLHSRTREEAAKAAGITSRTLRNYFDDAAFVRAYRMAASEALQDAVNEARQGISTALFTLRQIAENNDETASVRVTASRAMIELFIKLHEAADVDERLAELERQIAEIET